MLAIRDLAVPGGVPGGHGAPDRAPAAGAPPALAHDLQPRHAMSTPLVAGDRRLVRDAGVALLLFAGLAAFVLALFSQGADVVGPVPWQAWLGPALLAALGAAVLRRSVVAARVGAILFVVTGAGSALGAVVTGGGRGLRDAAVWVLIGLGVARMLWRAAGAMRRLSA